MVNKSAIRNPQSAIDFGGSGPLLHFAHANGYPPRAYTPLLELLATRYHVIAQPAQPLWPSAEPEGIRDWGPLADDFIRFLDGGKFGALIGVGHSLGAVTTLMAALRRPELFRALVLIDPVILPRRALWVWQSIKALGLGWRLLPLVVGALKRRRVFASSDEMYARYRRAPVFQRLSDDALRTYVEALAAPRADGAVELAYSPEWEARIYHAGIPNLWSTLSQLRAPMLLLYGAASDTFTAHALAQMKKLLPNATYHGFEDAGHLLPLEKPSEVAQTIFAFLDKVTG